MMLRSIVALSAFVFIPAVAVAEGDVSPGLWSYEASAALGPIPMEDAGTHCVDEMVSDSNYDALLNDINRNCSVTSSSIMADGYHFTMRCAGGPDGELTGRLEVVGDNAHLNATGWTGTAENNVPVIISASASKLAPTCS